MGSWVGRVDLEYLEASEGHVIPGSVKFMRADGLELDVGEMPDIPSI